MVRKLFQAVAVFLLFVLTIVPALSQRMVCKTSALSALKPIPKLKYKCNKDLLDYEPEVLTQANHLKAIKLYAKSLENFFAADWWKASVEDLNLCDFRKKTGVFNEEEKENYKNEYFPNLSGNNRFRMLSVADPCYQSGYNGADIFLLYRKNGKVVVSEMFDGYFSRSDYGPDFDFATLNNEPIIQMLVIGGGISPIEIYYFFTIDKKTNKAVPKNLFLDENHKPTNRIDSFMLMQDSEYYGLPPNLEGTQIVKNGRLVKNFDIFNLSDKAVGDDDHEKFERVALRWNGKFYE